jgi:hypothetical protein
VLQAYNDTNKTSKYVNFRRAERKLNRRVNSKHSGAFFQTKKLMTARAIRDEKRRQQAKPSESGEQVFYFRGKNMEKKTCEQQQGFR